MHEKINASTALVFLSFAVRVNVGWNEVVAL